MNSKPFIEVIQVFFKLGLIAFGGPAAHVAMMDKEIVQKRKWLSREHFLDLMGATNLIPGPNSTEMTMHCGYERAGVLGLFAAGISFILPAVSITCVFAYLYVEYGQLPQVEPFIMGIKPAVLAIIAGAVLKLGKKAWKNWQLGILGLGVLIASLLGANEILALLCAGVVGALFFYFQERHGQERAMWLIPFISLNAGSVNLENGKVFLSFLKVGAILYGSGYVLFAYLDAELVSTGLLTRGELIDAIAVGQFTPGPVLSTATFIGYQLGGFGGAISATVGIFLPSFLFVWLLNPLVSKMRQSRLLSHFLDSVNMSAVAIMLAVLLVMGKESVVNWQTMLIAVMSFVYTFAYKKSNAIITVLGGAVLGFLLSWIQ
ncbi:chromate efflux transporter [Chitinophagales bacterium]|nr:chromate efflux transporter [Chitinophagales bacterium]